LPVTAERVARSIWRFIHAGHVSHRKAPSPI
jgi:hypothetical protein